MAHTETQAKTKGDWPTEHFVECPPRAFARRMAMSIIINLSISDNIETGLEI